MVIGLFGTNKTVYCRFNAGDAPLEFDFVYDVVSGMNVSVDIVFSDSEGNTITTISADSLTPPNLRWITHIFSGEVNVKITVVAGFPVSTEVVFTLKDPSPTE